MGNGLRGRNRTLRFFFGSFKAIIVVRTMNLLAIVTIQNENETNNEYQIQNLEHKNLYQISKTRK